MGSGTGTPVRSSMAQTTTPEVRLCPFQPQSSSYKPCYRWPNAQPRETAKRRSSEHPPPPPSPPAFGIVDSFGHLTGAHLAHSDGTILVRAGNNSGVDRTARKTTTIQSPRERCRFNNRPRLLPKVPAASLFGRHCFGARCIKLPPVHREKQRDVADRLAPGRSARLLPRMLCILPCASR